MLQGKTAIVTGGTRGIGLAIVRTFLKNGANVALFGSRSETVGTVSYTHLTLPTKIAV